MVNYRLMIKMNGFSVVKPPSGCTRSKPGIYWKLIRLLYSGVKPKNQLHRLTSVSFSGTGAGPPHPISELKHTSSLFYPIYNINNKCNNKKTCSNEGTTKGESSS
jgi:hypothetical protein